MAHARAIMTLAFMLILMNAAGDSAQGVWVAAFAGARPGFQQAVTAGSSPAEAARGVRDDFEKRFPVAWDWLLQDLGPDWTPLLEKGHGSEVEIVLIESVLGELHDTSGHFREQLDLLAAAHTPSGDPRWLSLYHEGVALDESELRTIAAWIDLLVPFCGAYDEANAWSDEEKSTHDRLQEKRRAMEAVEQESIVALIAGE